MGGNLDSPVKIGKASAGNFHESSISPLTPLRTANLEGSFHLKGQL